MSAPTIRNAARVLLINPDDRILLFACTMASQDSNYTVWIAPGGGLKAGESHEDAARRELIEETGIELPELGPIVWHREHLFEWNGESICQRERFFFRRVEHQKVSSEKHTREEITYLNGFRWWSQTEIAKSDEIFAPHKLAELLANLLRDGPPRTPITTGV